MADLETVEAEATEIVGNALELAQPAPVNLFRTEDPAEVIRRATSVATQLAQVIEAQELFKQIGKKKHVLVEGWTLLGTMLGVFPVCEWTRKTEDGWEARVEARTLAGAVVGAAEAECLRSESLWKNRDDYALRSMAQTRATSKALRQPLGFIVTLSGFSATPAEEVPTEPTDRRVEKPKPRTPRSWADLERGMFGEHPDEAWKMFMAAVRDCSYHQWGETDRAKLDKTQKDILWQKAVGAYLWLHENVEQSGPFLIIALEDVRKAFASVLGGTMLVIPDYSPPTPEPNVPDEEAARLADETFEAPA